MSGKLKARLVERVVARLRELSRNPLLAQAQCRTALRKLGMTTGNAQRLFDEGSDVQLSRVEELAGMLKVSPGSLLSDDPQWIVEETPAIYQALPVVMQAVDQSPARAELRALLPLLADPDASRGRRLVSDLLLAEDVPSPGRPALNPADVEALIIDLVGQIDGTPAAKQAALAQSFRRVGLTPPASATAGQGRLGGLRRTGRRDPR